MIDTPSHNLQVRPLKLWIVLVLLLLFLLCPISDDILFSIASIAQDAFVMHRFSQPFFDYPLPERTQEISHETKLIYHGNHGCSFIASRLVDSDLSIGQIRDYYRNVGFVMPHGEPFFMDGEGLVRVSVTEESSHFRLEIWGGGAYEADTFLIGCGPH